MTSVNSAQFGEICTGVWRDRVAVLKGRGFLSGEAALVRAVYWRLYKVGLKPTASAENYGSLGSISGYQLGVSCLLELNARPRFDGAPFLKDLLQRYRNEIA
ncbi:MAG: hypothetical protein ACREBG_14235 [Pyrinomonadaceae bacterium]